MAWNNITYAYGSVLTSAKMTQNQDNFTALAQGLSGAPKILTAALNDSLLTGAKWPSLAAGATYALKDVWGGVTVVGTTPTIVKRMLCGFQGSVRTYFDLYANTGTANAKIYVNGAAYSATVHTATTTVKLTDFNAEDINVNVGDEIQLVLYHASGASQARNTMFRLATTTHLPGMIGGSIDTAYAD